MSKKDSTNIDPKGKKERVLGAGRKRFEFRKEWLVLLVVVAAGSAFLFWPRGEKGELRSGNSFVSYKRVKAKDGKVSLPMSQFADGEAKYFAYEFPEKPVYFFMLRSSDGIVRAAFDACDVCFRERKGYRQEGDIMVCNNCGQSFPSVRINVEKGGCNPAPLERKTVGDEVVLQVTDINKGLRYF